jgi:hypothetical protein
MAWSLADQTVKGSRVASRKLLILMEAAVGIEPTNKGLAVSNSTFLSIHHDSLNI